MSVYLSVKVMTRDCLLLQVQSLNMSLGKVLSKMSHWMKTGWMKKTDLMKKRILYEIKI